MILDRDAGRAQVDNLLKRLLDVLAAGALLVVLSPLIAVTALAIKLDSRGPLFYRLLVTGGPIDEQLAEGVADLILRGFAADEPGRATSRNTRKEQRQ